VEDGEGLADDRDAEVAGREAVGWVRPVVFGGELVEDEGYRCSSSSKEHDESH